MGVLELLRMLLQKFQKQSSYKMLPELGTCHINACSPTLPRGHKTKNVNTLSNKSVCKMKYVCIQQSN